MFLCHNGGGAVGWRESRKHEAEERRNLYDERLNELYMNKIIEFVFRILKTDDYKGDILVGCDLWEV